MGVSQREVERRYANVREALARDGLDAALVCGQRVHGLRGRGHVPLGLPDRPPLRLRAAARSRASRRSSSRPRRATSASTARRGSRTRSSPTTPATGSPTALRGQRVGVYGLDYVMTVRDYRGARGRGRARPVGRRVRPRARGEERRGARVGARERAHQHRGLLGLPRGATQPGPHGGRGARARRAALRRAGLRPADDEHGARRAPSSRSRASDDASRRLLHPLARGRRARRPLGRGLARDRRRRAPRCGACSRPTRSTSRPRRTACGPGATAHDVHRAVSQGLHRPRLPPRPRDRPLDRDDDDRVPEDRRGRRDRARARTWSSRCTRTRSPRTGASASTCRTPGSSTPTGASRSRGCR